MYQDVKVTHTLQLIENWKKSLEVVMEFEKFKRVRILLRGEHKNAVSCHMLICMVLYQMDIAGYLLGTGDRRILWLLQRILELNFTCFLRELCSSIIVLSLLYSILLPFQLFIMKSLIQPTTQAGVGMFFIHKFSLSFSQLTCMYVCVLMTREIYRLQHLYVTPKNWFPVYHG